LGVGRITFGVEMDGCLSSSVHGDTAGVHVLAVRWVRIMLVHKVRLWRRLAGVRTLGVEAGEVVVAGARKRADPGGAGDGSGCHRTGVAGAALTASGLAGPSASSAVWGR
jgi:hypothetical protein